MLGDVKDITPDRDNIQKEATLISEMDLYPEKVSVPERDQSPENMETLVFERNVKFKRC